MDSKEIRLINENHFLSLRKNMKNKEFFTKNNYILKIYENNNDNNLENINIKDIESKINKEKLFVQYSTCNDTISKLGYLMQMLIVNNDNFTIYGLYHINEFLSNIQKSEFELQNLQTQFNENMFKYLFEILDRKHKENDIILLIVSIINKLCHLHNKYCFLLMNYINNIINIITNISEHKNNNHYNCLKNNLFILINNIFLVENFNNYKDNLENNCKDFLMVIISEIYNIINNNSNTSFIYSKKIILNLLLIINNIFFYRMFYSRIFKNADKIKNKEKNIFDALKYILKNKTNYELNDSVILCLYNFIEYYLENKEKLTEEEQDEINYRICDINIPKYIIPLMFENKDKILNNDIKIYIFKILINTIYIGDCQYWSNLIEKKIASQIIKLQDFLLNRNIDNKDNNSSIIFEYHLLLIFNLVSTEYNEVISNIGIKYPVISNLFKFFRLNNNYINKHLDLFINILNGLIKNKCKYKKRQCNFPYIKTLLLSEGILEFFKKILIDEHKPLNKDMIKNIFIDILVLIEYFEDFTDDKKDNIVLLHMETIGMNEIINNYISKINLDDDIINILKDISNRLVKEE